MFGGWGLDARLGRITRKHGDVEFWVERIHAERSKTLLVGAGRIVQSAPGTVLRLAVPTRIIRRGARDARRHGGPGHERRRHARHEGAVPPSAQRPAMSAEGHRRHGDPPRAGPRKY
ncbi:hypothetical protein [Actinoplanes sp. URMC 104]|uniref:hypothetical protein n=1 Tax=Actinoplanes sp. URMC 104 TaxID=3423409 RepID=UPI003F1AF700